MDLYEMLLNDLGVEEEKDEVVKCFRCGKEVHIPYGAPRERFFCDECAELEDAEYQETLKTYIESKKRVTFENGIRMLEKTRRYNMNEIRDAVLEIKDRFYSGECEFQSTYEVLAAVVLRASEIEFEYNKPVGKYKIDFYIPSKTICLEVDGGLHKMRLVKDGKRDVEVRNILGAKWETIRIPTEYLKKSPDKLPQYLDEMYKKTKDEREKHNGILPKNFSKPLRAYYDTVFTDEYIYQVRKN